MIGTLFQGVARRHSSQIALRTPGETWTYDQLECRANQIANAIRDQGGAPDEPVALALGPEAIMVAAILGTLKSGRPYLPLDPRSPTSRLEQILGDAGATLLVYGDAQADLTQRLGSGKWKCLSLSTISSHSDAPTEVPVPSDALACILYTSGSTGQPKGVYQNHRNLVQAVHRYTSSARISTDDRLLLLAPLSLGASRSNLFGALLSGASLHLVDVRERGLDELIERTTDWNITTWHSTPTLFRRMVAALPRGRRLPGLNLVRLGGEPVMPSDLRLLFDRVSEQCVVQVAYSSTETHIACQEFYRAGAEIAGNLVPLGRPVTGVSIELVDERGQPVRAGEAGEIVVRSPYLALGYWRQPELTTSRFLTDAANPTVRRFRTGDLGHILPDGRLIHLGRVDQQVKVRGFRIDRTEIAGALASLPGVAQAAVVMRDDASGGKQLAGYVVPAPGVQIDLDILRRELAARLPDYMFPAVLASLDALPLTAGGKVDEKLLATPEYVRLHLQCDDRRDARRSDLRTGDYVLDDRTGNLVLERQPGSTGTS